MQVYQSLSQCSFSLYSITEVCRVVLLLFCCDMFLLKSFYSQSALSSSCSLQLLSSRSSWPWWPSVTLQSPSARMEISPTRLHLQVDHTSIDTASGYTVQCAALLSPQCTMRVCTHYDLGELLLPRHRLVSRDWKEEHKELNNIRMADSSSLWVFSYRLKRRHTMW